MIEHVLIRSLKNRGGLTRGRGMSPAVRMVWIRSMHLCGQIHDAMTMMTDHQHTTGEPHQELGSTRIKRDFEDMQKVMEWLNSRNPFDPANTSLRSLTSGITGDDSVNCDDTEQVGQTIHETLDDKMFVNASIKRKSQVKTLASMKNFVSINKKNVKIDPCKLFSKLVVLLERHDDIKTYFGFELTPIPTSLFLENFM